MPMCDALIVSTISPLLHAVAAAVVIILNQWCTTFCYCRLHYFYLYEVRPPMSSSYIYEIRLIQEWVLSSIGYVIHLCLKV